VARQHQADEGNEFAWQSTKVMLTGLYAMVDFIFLADMFISSRM
jgi:hypothetical protein